LRNRLTAW